MGVSILLNMVASVIDMMGGDSYESRIDRNAWRVSMGSASGVIMVLGEEDGEDLSGVWLLITVGIMRVPTSQALPFYRRLLELNSQLMGLSSFGVDEDNQVFLAAGRNAEGMDGAELMRLVHATFSTADRYDDELLDEFGREYALG